ncbi:zinc finger protein 862-like [Anastrepha obliqua]|uniref:zinc finger protein 862-like n=1 Tax=Anastrepha obliqua TaxID=95512 RepID=UPI002409E40D|nr:zinc finger protein 862-like [Anastrepha obliqua]
MVAEQGSRKRGKSDTSKSLTTPPRFKRYKEQYPWLIIKNDKGFCTDCTDACERKLVINLHSREVQSKKAWVDDGFSNWKHGADRLKIHSTTCLHLNCVEALLNVAKTNVVQQISTAHFKQMMDNRTALLKIFSTLKALAIQGLPIRGDNNDERSNFMTFLQARAEDVVELKAWLQRDGHKWLHHRSQNEILELMATTVSMEIIEDIRNAEYCSILLDETSDVSRIEQVSVCLRIVSEDLTAKEHFISFFSTSDTKAKTLFDLVEEIFQKYNLPLSKVRGQCYDGASNVSGNISGLQTRILEKESRAFVDKEINSAMSTKASGFYDYMECFDCTFYLNILIEMFDRIEILNKDLQKMNLSVIESYEKVGAVTDVLNASRDSKFEEIWQKSVQAAEDLEIDEPRIPRQRKIPKRLDTGTTTNVQFKTAKAFSESRTSKFMIN